MKAKKETTLFTVLTGSHLYGNASETSDFDYKAVCVPPLDELLLNTKITNRKEKPVGLKQGDKMAAGEAETEYLPLQVFLDDFFNGQTYALEVAFAVKQGKFELFSPNDRDTLEASTSRDIDIDPGYIRDIISDLINLYLTKNVKKMVGYAVSQSKLYGLKTQRYTSLNEALCIIEEYSHDFLSPNDNNEKLTFNDSPILLARLLALPHIKEIQIFNADGGSALAPALEICGKQYPYTSRISTVVKSMLKTVGDYGARVKEFDGQGVDWKALSHAIRITDQVLELCSTGFLTFPRPNAQFLLDVKTGKLTLDEATDYLNAAFAKVDDAIITSKLQERTPELEKKFREWKIQVLRSIYGVDVG